MRFASLPVLLAAAAACSRSESARIEEAREGCRRIREVLCSRGGMRRRWTPVESVLGSPLDYGVFWRRFDWRDREPFWQQRFFRRRMGRDPWGRPYEIGDDFFWWFILFLPDQLQVRSAGPDGKLRTGDDIVVGGGAG